jgi:predicted small lipoprotein YifL
MIRALLVALALALVACGQKGPLRLPDAPPGAPAPPTPQPTAPSSP